MGFNINGPNYKPAITEAQSMKNNGGGGNLGYFQRERKKKKKDNENYDLFEKESKDEDVILESEESEKISDKLKGVIGKLKRKPKNNNSDFFKFTKKVD